MSAVLDCATRLAAARTRLVLEHPFIGSLLMHLPLREADPAWCPTFASDGRAFYFNPRYVEALDFAQAQFVLAHEALHCALGHFARRAHRSVRRWDVACDHAVNLLLTHEGMKPAPGALLARDYLGLCAEEIYALIPPDTVERPLDSHLGGAPGRSAGPPALTETQRETLAAAWRARVVTAGQQARRAGRVASSWLRLVDDLVAPVLPWRELLARFVLSAAREDYSFERLSRREGGALLPRVASRRADVHVALDTSGSIAPHALAAFASEVDALKGQISARVTLHACDERLDARGPWVFEPWEPVIVPGAFEGGSGTRFAPVFDFIERTHARPDALVFFTDAEGEFPAHPPEYPVVWLVEGKAPVPWGERIQLN